VFISFSSAIAVSTWESGSSLTPGLHLPNQQKFDDAARESRAFQSIESERCPYFHSGNYTLPLAQLRQFEG
jgi:hypothetical protein